MDSSWITPGPSDAALLGPMVLGATRVIQVVFGGHPELSMQFGVSNSGPCICTISLNDLSLQKNILCREMLRWPWGAGARTSGADYSRSQHPKLEQMLVWLNHSLTTTPQGTNRVACTWQERHNRAHTEMKNKLVWAHQVLSCVFTFFTRCS